jgi:hypothetical protein
MGYINTNIDLVSLVEREAGYRYPKVANHYKFGPEHAGPCPFCKAGDDRFHIFPGGTRPHAFCRVCSWNGSPVKFLVDYRGMTWQQAFYELDIETSQGRSHTAKTIEPWMIDEPCEAWQERASGLIHEAQKMLWSKHGRKALDYLHQRGFTDETIHAAQLGYIPVDKDGRWFKQPLEDWGLSVTDPEKPDITLFEGILIPWCIGGVPWKLEVRRLTNVDPERKLPQIRGSADCFYHFDALQKGQPVVLVESALDALSGMQACCNGEVVFLATGGVKKVQHAFWRAALKQASCVLLAFDSDEPGNAGADLWKDNLPRAIRWPPPAHDINDMLTGGLDIREWVRDGIAFYTLLHSPAPAIPSLMQEARRFYDAFCTLPGHHLRLRSDGRIGIGVPDEMSDEAYNRISDTVERYETELRAILKECSTVA